MNPFSWSPDQLLAAVIATGIGVTVIAFLIFCCAIDTALAAYAAKRDEVDS